MIEKFNLKNSVYDFPFLPPIPEKVSGSTAQVSLCGEEWEFLCAPLSDIPSPWEEQQDYDFSRIKEGWQACVVPSELAMQGFDIKNNNEYYYRTHIDIPEFFDKGRIFLRFDSVYCNARIWVNGKYLTTHIGGFTPFDVEVTQFVGGRMQLVVGVADIEGYEKGLWNPFGEFVSDASWASYYAHHNICGILRGVTLYRLPKEVYLLHREISSRTDKVTLVISSLVICAKKEAQAEITLEYKDEELFCEKFFITEKLVLDGDLMQTVPFLSASSRETSKKVRQKDEHFIKKFVRHNRPITGGKLFGLSQCVILEDAHLWTAETPCLYDLKIKLSAGGENVEYAFYIGLREISVKGNALYVNGMPVKLRGVCRHDVSQQRGRSITREQAFEEVLAYKRNNVNFIRTSHYPPDKNIVEACDRFGIYIEAENSVCFKGGNGYGAYFSPQEAVQTMAETYSSYCASPACIIWSTGNESGFESSIGFRRSYEYIKEKDGERPVIFSYPHSVKTSPKPYDIYSKHYKPVASKLGRRDMPMLHDEFAHVCCYNLDRIKQDNSFRIIWGKSIKCGWDNILSDKGALGCAVWAAGDDIFHIPESITMRHQSHGEGKAVGFGPWGCIRDEWGREKPEAYPTKKAFSPIRVRIVEQDGVVAAEILNGFDHTCLNEVMCVLEGKTGKRRLDLPHTPPRGLCRIKIDADRDDEIVFFFGGYEVERLRVYEKTPLAKLRKGSELTASFPGGALVLQSDGFFTSPSGVAVNGKIYDGNFKVEKMVRYGDGIVARISKKCSFAKKVCCDVKIKDDTADVSVKLGGVWKILPVREFGVKWNTGGADIVEWECFTGREVYPEYHIGRACGKAFANAGKTNAYREKSPKWKDDVYDWFLTDKPDKYSVPVSRDFRTARLNARTFGIGGEKSRAVFDAREGYINCLAYRDRQKKIITCRDKSVRLSGGFTLRRGGKYGVYAAAHKKNASVSVEFEGAAIELYATRSKRQGEIEVFLDGKSYCKLNTRSDICETLDFAALLCVDCTPGKHTLTVVSNDGKRFKIGAFAIPGGECEQGVYVHKGKDDSSIGWGNLRCAPLKLNERKMNYGISIINIDKG